MQPPQPPAAAPITFEYMNQSSRETPSGRGLSRRTVVKIAAVSLVGSALGGSATAVLTRISRTKPAAFAFFTDSEAELLVAICEQLIPRDDTPGATDAGVIRYIDRQLAGKLARHQGTYRRGLASFHRACVAESGAPFLALTAEKKIETLRGVEAGRSAKEHWGDPAPREFFQLVLAHAMQGFYGPARHGGNRNHVSYQMLALDYPQIIGQNRYRKEGA